MEREIRRYRDTLKIIGTGVLGFGLWSILRTIIQLVFQYKELT